MASTGKPTKKSTTTVIEVDPKSFRTNSLVTNHLISEFSNILPLPQYWYLDGNVKYFCHWNEGCQYIFSETDLLSNKYKNIPKGITIK